MASATTLTSIAMLKVNKDFRDADYIDYLRPFVTEVLRKHRPNPIQDQVVALHLKNDFGIVIPHRGIQLVLSRLRKHRLLDKVDGVFRLLGDIPDEGLSQRRADAQRRIDALLTYLQEFASKTFDITWSADEAAEVLKSYLGDFAIECLRTFIHNTALPDVPKKSPKDIRIVHAFVRDAHKYSPDRFDNFILVVQGHMLANALLCPDLESLQKKFDSVTFYLDTPLVLRALGFNSKIATEAARELLTLIQNLKGRCAIFSHTRDEINRVLRSAALYEEA